eukprot:TRINITY_DN34375_c0_g1_i1.p1 TRINITY_DN34375_c0_g1~~TRINITY_DN34375_c0_g1_i1.p1  ORF type:complete len:400 (-),score=80.08 TRINITY_DN34375_c0_g1_i1:399-1505(-)
MTMTNGGCDNSKADSRCSTESLPTLLTSRQQEPKVQGGIRKPCVEISIPETELPRVTDFRVRNTFIDLGDDEEDFLEGFRQDRVVKSCPGAHAGRLVQALSTMDKVSAVEEVKSKPQPKPLICLAEALVEASQPPPTPEAFLLGGFTMPEVHSEQSSYLNAAAPAWHQSPHRGVETLPYHWNQEGMVPTELHGGVEMPPWVTSAQEFSHHHATVYEYAEPFYQPELGQAYPAPPLPAPQPPVPTYAATHPQVQVTNIASLPPATMGEGSAVYEALPAGFPMMPCTSAPTAEAFVAVATPMPPAAPAPGTEALPSIGSARHEFGECKPCAFLHTKGCENGAMCKFCHLCGAGEKKRRQKERKVALRGGA